MEILGSLDLKTILKSHRLKHVPSRFEYRLHETKISTLKIGHPKQEVSYSNHQFSQFLQGSPQIQDPKLEPIRGFSDFVGLLRSTKKLLKHRHFVPWSPEFTTVYKYADILILLLSPHHSVIPFFFNPFPLLRQCGIHQPGVYFLTWNKMRHLPHASCSWGSPRFGTVWISWDLGWGISLEASCHTWRIGSQDK